MDRKFPLPLPVFIITDKQGIQWLVLKSHQSCDQVITKLNRELFLFVDSIFIKEEDIHAFNSWAKDKNFSMEGGCRKVMARMNFFGTNIHGLIDISELNVMNMRNDRMVVHAIL